MLTAALTTLALVSLVSAHGALVAIAGANGIQGQGFAIVETTPRDGTRRNPFQADTSVFKANAGACGQTAEGPVDIATNTAAAVSAGVPSMDSDGTVTMTIHQVNGDGAGPYACGVSADATGASFVAMTVTTNVPGQNSRSNARATDFPLVAAVAPGTTCTGAGGTCLVRCMNAALAAASAPAAAAAVAPVGKNNRRVIAYGRRSIEEPLSKRVAISFAHLFPREVSLTPEEVLAIELQVTKDDLE
ncbi:hypothetical protein RQP46_011022 [Phenoliferia psychrophenolica]